MRVDPIKDPTVISKIQKRLIKQGKIRDAALFTIGCNTNLRASDLVRLRVSDVDRIKAGESFVIREIKTGKPRNVYWNESCHNAAQMLLKDKRQRLRRSGYLFASRKGGSLSPDSVYRLVREWTVGMNLPGHYGSHTLRKTWGYMQYHCNPDRPSIATLMTAFNHSSERETLLYLGIEEEDLRRAFAFKIGCI